MDPTTRHPAYLQFADAWRLMREAQEGEDTIKAAGERYLPMKSGTRAMSNADSRALAYAAYKARAEFPELVAPTIRGALGVMLAKPAAITLPPGMEEMRERATRDGLTLESLHRRIVSELLLVGRYGLLPSVLPPGRPYLAGYSAETIINWDAPEAALDFVVLDETALVRDPAANTWGEQERLRELALVEGRYQSRVWVKGGAGWVLGEWEAAEGRTGPVAAVPFVFIDTNDLTPDPDDVPLYGLAKLAVRVYRMDADYTHALHMTSEPTPVAIGVTEEMVRNGTAPKTLGSSVLWQLPEGGDAKYLEFSGAGLSKQREAIEDAFGRALTYGAQLLADQGAGQSGDAIRLRLGNQTATLKTLAQNAAAGLESALRNLAVWLGEDPEAVTVTPHLDFFDEALGPADITAIVSGWQAGAYSWPTLFDRLKRGGVIPEGRTEEEEQELILQGGVDGAL